MGGDGKPPGPLPSLRMRRQNATLFSLGLLVRESFHCTRGIISHCFPTVLPLPQIDEVGFLKVFSCLEISLFSLFFFKGQSFVYTLLCLSLGWLSCTEGICQEPVCMGRDVGVCWPDTVCHLRCVRRLLGGSCLSTADSSNQCSKTAS